MIATWLSSSCSALLLSAAAAPAVDSEAPPYAYVQSATRGVHYFRMEPDAERPYDLDAGHGRVYRVSSEGDELLWEVKGWYAFTTFLSADGKYLVRMGNWARGGEPEEADLAVAFYAEGKLLRSYSTRALIQDDSKVQRSVSHYSYQGTGPVGFVRTDASWAKHWFEFTTIDQIRYTFDRRTGDIVKSVQLGGEEAGD